MKDISPRSGPKNEILSGPALYMAVLAWIIFGLHTFFIRRELSDGAIGYFLSIENAGVKFRALTLLAPFILTIFSYFVHERARLLKKTFIAEKELRQRAIELENVSEQLANQASYDSLTNLPNRALFIDRLHSSLERNKRYQNHSFAVLFLDLDRFKVVNDGLGHAIGDQILIMLAQRLKKHVRSIDTIGRFGGDEFAVLLEDMTEESCVSKIAERLQGEMISPFSVFGYDTFLTMSMGIVLSNMGDYKRSDELLRDAETAMYKAKARGKACHVIFDSSMHTEASRTLQLETELRRAVERNEFKVFYQPIISVGDNKIIGFEALLRWQHPARGIITPSEFIKAAEETGLIFPLGQWVIREACGQLKAWQEQFPSCRNFTVSVNVSSGVFSQQNFYELVHNILQETGLDGSCLRLEIVERMLIEDPEPAAALMSLLNDLNVRFDIDDFGIGYSALNYLRHFPIKGLKIDRSFIKALTFDKNNVKIVKTIIALGHDLGLDVIAEGIETVEQLDIFKTMNGEYAQGFFLFRPMDSKAVECLLAASNVVPRKVRFSSLSPNWDDNSTERA